jgi:methylphosphotriester-DNA--protein-cysteine methyltransferase
VPSTRRRITWPVNSGRPRARRSLATWSTSASPLALDRLQAGEDDLARLAAELGFAGHSHFTEQFRRSYGATPSQVRKILTARRAAAP